MTKHDNTRPGDVKRQIPNAQASAGRPYGFPETNSGGWYAGVPSTVPDMGTVGGKVALERKMNVPTTNSYRTLWNYRNC